jgi:uncharacterized protein YndB with AHSA1/START domain
MTDALRYQRIIAAAPEVVFDAFTSPDGQLAFYGEDDHGWTVRSESEVRVGGHWTILFGPSLDQLYRHHHVFRALDRPRYLLLATTETRLDGTTLRFETEFTFEEVPGGTLMTMLQRGLPTDELRAEHGRGVPNAFERLEQHIHNRHTHPTSHNANQDGSPARHSLRT